MLSAEKLCTDHPTITWYADMGCGTPVIDHIVENMFKIWHILLKTKIPLQFIVNFAQDGFCDDYLPYSYKKLKRLATFLNENFIQFFLEQQKEYFAVKFAPMEHKILTKGQNIPYIGIRSAGGNRSGSYGHVIKVKETVNIDESSERVYYYARKESHGSEESERILNREAEILRKIPKSDYLIGLIASYSHKNRTSVILTPWCDTNLNAFFERKEVIPVYENMGNKERWSMISNWLPCLAYGLTLLHDKKIRHKDIKPANILLNIVEYGAIPVLCDFGLSKEYSLRTKGDGGTQYYESPERLQGYSVGRSGDIFALGCVFLEIANFINGSRKKLKKLMHKRGFAEMFLKESSAQRCIDMLPSHNAWWVGFIKIIKDMLNITQSERPRARLLLSQICQLQKNAGLEIPFPCISWEICSSSGESDENNSDYDNDESDEERLY